MMFLSRYYIDMVYINMLQPNSVYNYICRYIRACRYEYIADYIIQNINSRPVTGFRQKW